MVPGMPTYTKLGNGNVNNVGAASVYSVPPSPPPDHDKIRSSHTLFDMLSNEQSSSTSSSPADHLPMSVHFQLGSVSPQHSTSIKDQQQQQQAMRLLQVQPPQNHFIPLHLVRNQQPNSYTQQQQQQQQQQCSSLQERVNAILCSPVSSFNDATTGDLKLTLIGRDGNLSVTVSVHKRILVASSKYFASKLTYKQQSTTHSVEISDCEDVEIYLITIRLMYSSELRRMLLHENVPRVLAILKVASAIVFEAAITASLEYLEAVPWAEEDEENIYFIVSQLQNEYPAISRCVLNRFVEPASSTLLALPAVHQTNANDILHLHPEEIMVRLVNSVIKATDEKARRELKALVFRLLRENAVSTSKVIDISKESLYEACRACLDGLLEEFSRISEQQQNPSSSSSITRQVDSIQWLADILMDRGMADDLVSIWSRETKLAEMHQLIPSMQRHEVSKITARLCIGIGRGQIMAAQAVRAMLLSTWLKPLMDDFSWIHRSKSCTPSGMPLDKRSVEEGLCCTILTLPLDEQKCILMSWFQRFAQDGDDCPNLQRAFEVWWRRTFVSRHLQAV